MAVEEDNEASKMNNTTQSTPSNNIPTNEPALVMSTRSTELETRYQQLLERRILALERQLAPIEPAEKAEAATVASGTDTKDAKDKQSSSDATKGSHGRKTIMVYDQSEHAWISETPKAEDEATTNIKKDPDPEPQCAFKFIEYYKEKAGHRTYDESGIEIFSKELINKVKATPRPNRAQVWGDTEGNLRSRSPYTDVLHHWDELVEQTMVRDEQHIPGPNSESERARETREALADLLECITTARELKDYFKTRDTNIAKQVTSFEYLWTFFPPGTKVVASPFMGTQQLFLVEGLKKLSD
ncbi:MAG: hypothetical protein Q9172_007376 [Xanthocarpia lactea]